MIPVDIALKKVAFSTFLVRYFSPSFYTNVLHKFYAIEKCFGNNYFMCSWMV